MTLCYNQVELKEYNDQEPFNMLIKDFQIKISIKIEDLVIDCQYSEVFYL